MAKETNREKVLAALIETSSIRDAAKKCGIGEATIYRHLQDKEFLAEYRNARRATVENAIASIQAATGEAVEALRRNLSCSNPQAEIRSAAIILDTSKKGVELIDFIQRLEILEQNANQKT
jgi:AcrR family transcriptional regulator